MSLLGRLNDDMKQAMKNKQKEKLTVIRMVKALYKMKVLNCNILLLKKRK